MTTRRWITDRTVYTPRPPAPKVLSELDEALAALSRVTKLALDMRTWCSPYGIAPQYADDIAKALLGETGLLPHGEALKRLEAEYEANQAD